MYQFRLTVVDAIEAIFHALDEHEDVCVYLNTTATPPIGAHHLVIELTEPCTLIQALILAFNRCKMERRRPKSSKTGRVTPSELTRQLFVSCRRYGLLSDEEKNILYDPPSRRQLAEYVIRIMAR